jgi:hypothetical protein
MILHKVDLQLVAGTTAQRNPPLLTVKLKRDGSGEDVLERNLSLPVAPRARLSQLDLKLRVRRSGKPGIATVKSRRLNLPNIQVRPAQPERGVVVSPDAKWSQPID